MAVDNLNGSHPVVKKSQEPIYPEATKRLPGNNAPDNAPGVQHQDRSGDKKIYKRMISLFFYTIAILVFGVISILTLLANHRGFQNGEKPILLEIFGYAAAVIPIVCSVLLLTTKKAALVSAALVVLFFGYLSIVAITFVMIIENFANFFTGIGLVCVLHIGLMFWTRQEFNEVHEIRYY